uniref:Vav guanine nucleotide exchange factor 1 n=1 Tax=Catharus ustulatus TaxID=91951 RepID=A0A8C3ULM2_CATUS
MVTSMVTMFLCLRNIRTFLTACADKFGLPKHRLFGAFDLFDVQDFGKVGSGGQVSWRGVPFPSEDSVGDDDIYSGLSDLIDDTAEEDDELYDCVEAEGDDGDDVYEDLMRVEPAPAAVGVTPKQPGHPKNSQDTPKNTWDTPKPPGAPQKHLGHPKNSRDTPKSPGTTKKPPGTELLELHRRFLGELRGALGGGGGGRALPPLFLQYKERFLLYGRYCSQVEAAARRLDQLSTCTDLRMKLQECSQRANNGRFSLRDLLMVPMQRVLKYHLLLQELVKLTPDAAERERLRGALDAMRDLAQCVNEVKRDNETLKQLTSIQLCTPWGHPAAHGGLGDTVPPPVTVPRYGFLLDKALIICKRRGDSYEAKDVVELQSHQLRDGGLGPRDGKKWSHTFVLLHTAGLQDYELFFKTRELKKKWLEQFEMALSNIFPEHALADGHDFQMFSFEDTTSCKACQMLLRGTFYQGYRCSRCRAPAHKECLGRVGTCGKAGSGEGHHGIGEGRLPKMESTQPYSGVPPPPGVLGPPLRLSPGDVIEVTTAEAEELWWQVGDTGGGTRGGGIPEMGVGPSGFGGPLERAEAEQALSPRSDGAFLVRQRLREPGDFAISVKFRGQVKHIKVAASEGLYWVTERKAFRGLVELVQFYQRNSLRDCFKALDTTLALPYRDPETRAPRSFGSAKARYDFSARDRTELSLREGDIVRVLSKRGQPGWWKGEIYGRVGWFPANYVDEDYSDYC